MVASVNERASRSGSGFDLWEIEDLLDQRQ
jgi:hypothetical protein